MNDVKKLENTTITIVKQQNGGLLIISKLAKILILLYKTDQTNYLGEAHNFIHRANSIDNHNNMDTVCRHA